MSSPHDLCNAKMQISLCYYRKDPKKTLEWIQAAQQHLSSIQDNTLKGQVLYYLARSEMLTEQLDSALLHSEQSLSLIRPLGKVRELCWALNVKAAVLISSARTEEARKYIAEALQYEKDLLKMEPELLSRIYVNMGNSYIFENDQRSAEPYFEKAVLVKAENFTPAYSACHNLAE